MVLNRKSSKTTSHVSLFIAVAMLCTVFTVLAVQGVPVEQLAGTSAQLCKDAGVFEMFVSLLW